MGKRNFPTMHNRIALYDRLRREEEPGASDGRNTGELKSSSFLFALFFFSPDKSGSGTVWELGLQRLEAHKNPPIVSMERRFPIINLGENQDSFFALFWR
jgi:hypothetical protein